MSEQLKCRFRTPAKVATRPSFAWSGDLAGQGFRINPDIGGYRLLKTVANAQPDLFINCGDVICADTPLRESKKVAGDVLGGILSPTPSVGSPSLWTVFGGNTNTITLMKTIET